MKQHELKVEVVPVSAIHPHPSNPRRGNVEAIADSIEHNGFYGVIVASRRTGNIVAGNHRYRAMVEMGETTVPVQYLDITPDEERRILLADNKTADDAGYDDAALTELLSSLQTTDAGLAGTGWGDEELTALLDGIASDVIRQGGGGDYSDGSEYEPDVDPEPEAEPQTNYSRKIEAPVYEVTGKCPTIQECVNTDYAETLLAEIEAANLPADVREFLRQAATRHYRFHFENVAEYYAHASPDVQRLMERSAMVIIDYNAAIENGFVRLSKELMALHGQDYPEGGEGDADEPE
jgi:hypothetical protein